MRAMLWRGSMLALLLLTGAGALAQTGLSWDEVRQRFEAANPTLRAGQLNVDESKAQEITAHLRPNPNLTVAADQIDPFNSGPAHGPFAYFLPLASVNYLHERQHKRELRLESAQKGTAIAASDQADLERTLLFDLRGAFVQTLQSKAVLQVAQDNLTYYDRVLGVGRDRLKAGDIAQIDLDRLEVQRVQFESDVQTAAVNLRSAKIQLLALLNDRRPVEQFDVIGAFDFDEINQPLSDLHQAAINARPDLRAAAQAVERASTDHLLAVANGSTDPVLGFDVGRNPPIDSYFGVSVSVPLRIFDRNQGEKQRTQLDIERQQRLRTALEAEVFRDVDSAYTTLNSTVTLLRPYKQKYLQQALRVRDTVYFSYQHGGSSLIDFLNAETEYRSVQLNYLNLIGSYLMAGAQLNMAVGREVIP